MRTCRSRRTRRPRERPCGHDAGHFPEDLVFQETRDKTNFQARFVLRHEWRGDGGSCSAAAAYRDDLQSRWEREAQTLASLTGRDVQVIRERMRENGQQLTAIDRPWWRKIWGG